MCDFASDSCEPNSFIIDYEDNCNDIPREPIVILVTGGAGFIGSHVADALLTRGDKVIIVDEINDYYDVRLKCANLDYLIKKHGHNVQVLRGDICDVDFMSDVFERERPSHICHLAARAGVRPSITDPYIYVHSNIEGTTRLLDLARQYECKNFVYASSSSVYGNTTKEILSESDVVERPVSPYAATKKSCELLAYTFHHLYGLNTTGLRFFTVYGPRGRPDMAPFKFIERVFNGVPIQQYGDGSTSRDYTFITDIVDGVVRAIDRPLGYEIFNLGNGRPFLLSNFISLVEEHVGKKAIIQELPIQPGDVERTCADIRKAKELLGYQPRVPFEEGIALTAAWYKEAFENGLFADNNNENNNVESSHPKPTTAAKLDVISTTSSGSNISDHPPTSLSKASRFLNIHHCASDLELDSHVDKASYQMRQRTARRLT